MRYQLFCGKTSKTASTWILRQSVTAYRLKFSSFRQRQKPFQLISQYSSTSSLTEAENQQRQANLRSQLSLPIQISSTPQFNHQDVPKKSRSLRPYIYALLFFAFGSLTGSFLCDMVIPRVSPVPGSSEDEYMIEYLQDQAEKIPLLQSLRSDPLWNPVDTYNVRDDKNSNDIKNEQSEKILDEEKQEILRRRLTAGPLGGSRALGGFQKMFCNKETGEIIKIIWLGKAISGWPGVVHGGVLATVLDETLGRCAMGFLKGSTGVTANLQVNYLRPTLTNGFYVIRATPVEDEEGVNETKGFTDQLQKRKQWVNGTLESAAGVTCVKAKALFVVPKKYKLGKIEP